MERIVIEVNKSAAKKWRTSSRQQKRKLAAVLQKALATDTGVLNEPRLGYARPPVPVLQAHFNRVQKDLPEYKKFLDELSKKAAERGLTEEILEELLQDDV